MTGHNAIPRKFYYIIGKLLIDTSIGNAGDNLHIYKNQIGYLALNKATGECKYFPAGMLRDKQTFKILDIDK